MQVILPTDAGSITPENTANLRYAVREKDGSGFIFLNNYQDHVEMQDIEDIVLELQLDNHSITLPHTQPLVLQKNVTAMLPFGLVLNGIKLVYATTQLLTQIADGETNSYFFFAPSGMQSEYAFATASYESLSVKGGEVIKDGEYSYVTITPGLDAVIKLTTHDGQSIRIFTLTRQQAEQATLQCVDQKEHLLISAATLVMEGDQLFAYSLKQEKVDILIYPPIDSDLNIEQSYFSRYITSVPKVDLPFQQETIAEGKVVLRFPDNILNNVHNVLLHIDYVGDIGQAYIDGKLVHDNFYNGTGWEIGLRHLEQKRGTKDLLIMIVPIEKQLGTQRYVPTGMAFRPDLDAEHIAHIDQITLVPEYKIPISF